MDADQKLTHLQRLCLPKIDPCVLLALLVFWAGENKVMTMEMLGKLNNHRLKPVGL